MEPSAETHLSERRALGWAALLAAAGLAYLVAPISLGVLLGTLLAFMMRPVFGSLQRRFGVPVASTLTVLGTSLLVSVSIAGLAWMLASRGTLHMSELLSSLNGEGQEGGGLKPLAQLAERIGLSPAELAEKARGIAASAATRVASAASAVLTLTADSLLGLFFMMLAMHFVLREPTLVVRIAKDILPLKPEWTISLAGEFRRVGKATLLGTLVTGLAQGLLATLGYWIAGVPDPVFYGAATAVASLVPAVGTLLVWVPVGVVMLLTDHVASGVVVLAWGALIVVGLSDYFIRPKLIGGESPLPPLVTFAALFGGVEAFGLKGLIVGPVLMSLSIAVLRIWSAEVRRTREVGP